MPNVLAVNRASFNIYGDNGIGYIGLSIGVVVIADDDDDDEGDDANDCTDDDKVDDIWAAGDVSGCVECNIGIRRDVESNSLSANALRLRIRSVNGDTYTGNRLYP